MKIPRMTTADEERIADAIAAAASDPASDGDPDGALAKAAEDFNLPPGHVPILVRAYNTARSGLQRDGGSGAVEKAAAFPMASDRKVIARLFPPAVKTAAAADPGARPAWADALSPARDMEKLARDLQAWGDGPPALPPRDEGLAYAAARTASRSSLQLLDRVRGEVAATKLAAQEAFDDLADALRPVGTLPWRDLRDGVVGRHGDAGAAVMEAVARRDSGLAKRASVDRFHAASAHPRLYALADAAVARIREHDAAAADLVAAVPLVYAKVAREMAPFLPPDPAAVGDDLLDGLIAKEALSPSRFVGDVVKATALGKARDGLEHVLSPPPAVAGHGRPTYEQVMGKLTDPAHEAKVRDLENQYAVQSMLVDDPVLSSYAPGDVAAAFNEISRTAPHLASQPLVMRPLLRKALVSGGLDSFEADQAVGADGKLRDGAMAPLALAKLRLEIAKLRDDAKPKPKPPADAAAKPEKRQPATVREPAESKKDHGKDETAPSSSSSSPPRPSPVARLVPPPPPKPYDRNPASDVDVDVPDAFDLATAWRDAHTVPDRFLRDNFDLRRDWSDSYGAPSRAATSGSLPPRVAATFPVSPPGRSTSFQPGGVKRAIDMADGTVEEAAAHLAAVAAAVRAAGPMTKAANGDAWSLDLAGMWDSVKNRAGDAWQGYRGLGTPAQAAVAGAGLGALTGGLGALAKGKSKRRAASTAMYSALAGGLMGGGGGYLTDAYRRMGPVASPEEARAVFRAKPILTQLSELASGQAPEGLPADYVASLVAETGKDAAKSVATRAGGFAAGSAPMTTAGLAAAARRRYRDLAAQKKVDLFNRGYDSISSPNAALQDLAHHVRDPGVGPRAAAKMIAAANGRGTATFDALRRGRNIPHPNPREVSFFRGPGKLRAGILPAAGAAADLTANYFLNDPNTETGWVLDTLRHVPSVFRPIVDATGNAATTVGNAAIAAGDRIGDAAVNVSRDAAPYLHHDRTTGGR